MGQATDCRTLLTEYKKNCTSVHYVEKLSFSGVGNKDVYNITAPFYDEMKKIIGARVEDRDSEDSIVAFFEKVGQTWQLMKDMPTFSLQDPFVTRIDGLLVFGGVKVSTERWEEYMIAKHK